MAGDEVVDLTIARQAEEGHLLLQAPNGEPGLAAGRVLRGIEDNRNRLNQKSA